MSDPEMRLLIQEQQAPILNRRKEREGGKIEETREERGASSELCVTIPLKTFQLARDWIGKIHPELDRDRRPKTWT
jgi:hypothetical protein